LARDILITHNRSYKYTASFIRGEDSIALKMAKNDDLKNGDTEEVMETVEVPWHVMTVDDVIKEVR
jgi:hypothetical protein